MNMLRIIALASVLTIVWMLFAINAYLFAHERPPRANVVPSQTMQVGDRMVVVPMPDEAALRNGDMSLPFMTQEELQRKVGEYQRTHILHGVLALVFGIVTFGIGARVGEHWGYGLACVLFGPLAVARFEYMRAKPAKITTASDRQVG
jgi:hypothetical protein